MRELIRLAECLPDGSRCPHRGPTQATIFAVLATLGLRIGEVSRLTCGDVDLERETLLIRNSKFGKSRVLPCDPRLAARLRTYLSAARPVFRSSQPRCAAVLLARARGRSSQFDSQNLSRPFAPTTGLTIPPGTSQPCVHGLRHSLAVRSLLRWYREGLDPAARLNHLSTFLGHVNPQSTAVYLTITASCSRRPTRASRRMQRHRARGDGHDHLHSRCTGAGVLPEPPHRTKGSSAELGAQLPRYSASVPSVRRDRCPSSGQ